jgi:hypothetical protein
LFLEKGKNELVNSPGTEIATRRKRELNIFVLKGRT